MMTTTVIVRTRGWAARLTIGGEVSTVEPHSETTIHAAAGSKVTVEEVEPTADESAKAVEEEGTEELKPKTALDDGSKKVAAAV